MSRGTSGIAPTGTVSFFNGTTLVGSAVVVNGTATLSLPNLAVGTYSLKAVYSGDATSATTLYASTTDDPAQTSGSLTLVAQVSGALPGGTVTFYAGATAIVSVAVTDGLAKVTLVPTGTGLTSFTARYSGCPRSVERWRASWPRTPKSILLRPLEPQKARVIHSPTNGFAPPP